ncbi:hypothetical protein E1A91_D06G164700v1 [Gossypium mustelinum]|uniref:Uncharacterized protein n=1 Tax=Gossypium mustelinum TaxID=34275 RepID=A0A5D2UMH4_GOSMU|nr:hypothetical protein E1A91_D06G164700v1 [Gossypium mustelinum]
MGFEAPMPFLHNFIFIVRWTSDQFRYDDWSSLANGDSTANKS